MPHGSDRLALGSLFPFTDYKEVPLKNRRNDLASSNEGAKV